MRRKNPIGGCAAAMMLLTFFTAFSTAAADEFRPTAQDRYVPTDARLEPLWCEGVFTEGPVQAPDGAILFSDIGSVPNVGNRIMRFHPTTGHVDVFRSPSGRSNGLAFNARGELIACEGPGPGGGRRISITSTDGAVRTLADRYQGKRFNSPNDLALDAAGRIYFTDPRYGDQQGRELDFEGVFLVEPDGAVRLATRDVEKPNGVLVSHDQKSVYLADNNSAEGGARQLLRFDIQPDGALTGKRVLFDFGPAGRGVDGMTLDRSGVIHATAGTGEAAGVYIFDAQGTHLALIRTPGNPTNCTFAADGAALYVTAAGQAGKFCLYRIQLGAP